MFSLTSLLVVVASIAILANGFILRASHRGRLNGEQVFLSEDGALYVDRRYGKKPADFEFDKDELIVAGTNKVVYVLENGESYAIERGLEPAKARSTAFSYKNGILDFNNARCYAVGQKEDEFTNIAWAEKDQNLEHYHIKILDLSIF